MCVLDILRPPRKRARASLYMPTQSRLRWCGFHRLTGCSVRGPRRFNASAAAQRLAIGPTTAKGLSVPLTRQADPNGLDGWWGTRGREIEFASPSEERV